MSIIKPEVEIIHRTQESLRYLEHGWPSDLCRWHAHEDYEIHLILETNGTSFVGDYIGQFQPGSLFLTGPSLPHNWVTHTSENATIAVRDMLVQFHQNTIGKAIEAFPEISELQQLLTMAKSGIEFERFPMAVAKQYLEQMRDRAGVARFISFIEFLNELNSWPQKNILSVSRMSAQLSQDSQSKINEIVDYVLENYRETIVMGKAAKIVGMSESAFSRYFSNKTGNRFSEFVMQVRIGQACKLLYETEQKISTVCFASGFNNLANFNRQFLKVKKITPRDYRKIAGKGLRG